MLSPTHAARRARFVRLARWWQSWRLALRLARRDAWAHKGRSLLIVILVAAPVLLVGTLATWFATTEISVRESLPVRLGNAQAEISVVDGGRWAVEQLADGRDSLSSEEARKSVRVAPAGHGVDRRTARRPDRGPGGRGLAIR